MTFGRRAIVFCLASLAVGVGVVGASPDASAHRDGCHAAHSCPFDTGSYVCGDTGNDTYCPGRAERPSRERDAGGRSDEGARAERRAARERSAAAGRKRDVDE